MKEGYKKTELGWIPEGWKIENLDSISSLIDGDRSSNYPSPNEIVDDGIIFLSTSNIKNNKLVYNECKYITQEKFDSLKKGKLKDGDLIITLRGSIGNVAKFNVCEYDTGFINAQMLIIRSEKIDSSFLWIYLTSQKCQSEISTISSGSAQPQLTKKDLSSLKIVVPPLKEQQKIAEILSIVDSQIDDTDKLIENTKKLKKGLMQRLLTKGIGHTEFKMTEIGEIPVKWEVKTLENVCEFLDGMRKPIKAADREKMKGNIPYYGASGIIDWVNDYIFNDEIILLGEDGENIKSRNVPLAFKVKGKCWVNNHAHVLKTKGDNNSDFITYVLENKDYSMYVIGSAQPKLNQAQCRKILIQVPTIKEQQKIADILLSVDNEIDEYENKKVKLEQLKKALMQQLLTGKIRVKV